jgi:hypothetical protein
MEQSKPPLDTRVPESIYTGITRWATHAPRPLLSVLALLGLGAAAAVLFLDWHRWPLAGMALAASTIGLWGLVDQRAAHPLTRTALVAEQLIAGLGFLGGGAAALGVLLWALGDAPGH